MPIGKVLVIDDEAIIRNDIAFVLQDMDYEVFKTGKGNSGIAIAIRETPQWVICDFNLPDMTGLEVAKEMKKIESLQTMRFILCTGAFFGEEDLSIVDGYLVKPFIPRQLANLIQQTNLQ